VLDSPPAGVRVTSLGPNDVTLQVRFWADSRRSDFVETASAVRRASVQALRDAGVALPDANLRVVRQEPSAAPATDPAP
jgi:small-conductance mechanosensitive channel